MPVTDTQIASLPNASPASTTPAGKPASSIEEGLAPDAAFRKKYGIPPKGTPPAGGWADSDYGFPLPPANHPDAKKYARAVLSRAHQNGTHDPADVAKQVAKARRILGEKPDGAKESRAQQLGIFPLREVGSGKDPGTARVIIIREGPGNLGDRHYYTASTLAASVKDGLWEGAQCFFDHPTLTEDRDIPERSVKNLAGWFSDAKIVDYVDPEFGKCKAVEATFHPQSGEDRTVGLLRTCVEYAKAFPDKSYVGLSINACGDGQPAEIGGEEWNRVDKITEVVSVDFVTRAGAGGKPITFRESVKAARTLKNLDPAKIKEAVRADLSAAKQKFLEDAAIQLTPEQDQALDAALGIVDGGKLDQVIDAAVGVSPADDDNNDVEESAIPMETAEEKKEREAREKREKEAREKAMRPGDEGGPGAGNPDTVGDELDEAEKSAIEAMSPEDLKKFAAQAKAKEKREKRESEEKERKEREAKEAKERENREAAVQLADANRKLKERAIRDAFAAQRVPDTFRPRLERELMERAAITSDADIAKFISDEMAFAAPVGAGVGMTFRETGSAGSAKLDLSFKPRSSYDE